MAFCCSTKKWRKVKKMKKTILITGALLLVVGIAFASFMISQPVSPDGVTHEDSLTGMAVYLTQTVPAFQIGTLNQLPATSTTVPSVSAQIVDPAAVQSVTDSEVLVRLYYFADGSTALPTDLKISEWDGVKPPTVLTEGQVGWYELSCELDVALSDDSQTVYRCGPSAAG
jgi:hypothetical protein